MSATLNDLKTIKFCLNVLNMNELETKKKDFFVSIISTEIAETTFHINDFVDFELLRK